MWYLENNLLAWDYACNASPFLAGVMALLDKTMSQKSSTFPNVFEDKVAKEMEVGPNGITLRASAC